LRYHGWKTCADPRDKVYGLLGIISQYEREQIVIDYKKSVVEAYINVVEHLFSTTRRIMLFVRVFTTCASKHIETALPNGQIPLSENHWRYYNLNFSAAGITNATYTFSERCERLVVSAVPIASITICGTPVHEMFTLDDIRMAFFQWRMKFVTQFGYDDEIAHERFCRTLCCDKSNPLHFGHPPMSATSLSTPPVITFSLSI
jgi:hypothetical protein